jgi:hypothetical protein
MRIVSKFKDYYDPANHIYPSDSTYTFVRDTREIDLVYRKSTWEIVIDKKDYKLVGFVVGFCGEAYPGITVQKRDSFGDFFDSDFVYSVDQLEKSIPGVVKSLTSPPRRRYMWGSETQLKSLELWFAGSFTSRYYNTHSLSISDVFGGIFDKEKVAYFCSQTKLNKSAGDARKVDIYPNLEHINFYRVFDMHETFQKLEIYLTNILVKPDEINIHISDELKAQAHGYDKFSFRKDKKDVNKSTQKRGRV